MTGANRSRRGFIATSGLLATGSWLGLNLPLFAVAERAWAGLEQGKGWKCLSGREAGTLGAVADQIFPPDDQPGASALGAVYFMDAALDGFMSNHLPLIQAGCADLDRNAGASPGGFEGLAFDDQTPILQTVEATPFFGAVHMLTLAGVFAMPSYGGNRQQGGWRLIGFEPRHVWQPPFGHYDAAYARLGDSDGT